MWCCPGICDCFPPHCLITYEFVKRPKMAVLLKHLRHFTWKEHADCNWPQKVQGWLFMRTFLLDSQWPDPLSLVFDDSFRKMLSASLQSVLNSAGHKWKMWFICLTAHFLNLSCPKKSVYARNGLRGALGLLLLCISVCRREQHTCHSKITFLEYK